MSHNFKNNSFKLFFTIFCFVASCRPVKTASDASNNVIYHVKIEYLTDSISKFHGRTIQTQGYFSIGFEDQSLSPAIAIYDSTNNSISFQIKSFPSLWIEFNNYSAMPDRIEEYNTKKTGRLVTIQGVIDTMNTGHMGYYKAAIVKAKLVVESP